MKGLEILLAGLYGVGLTYWLRAWASLRRPGGEGLQLCCTVGGFATAVGSALLLAKVALLSSPIEAMMLGSGLLAWVLVLRFGLVTPLGEDLGRQISTAGQKGRPEPIHEPLESIARMLAVIRKRNALEPLPTARQIKGIVSLSRSQSEMSSDSIRLHCPSCGTALTAPLREIAAPTPAAFTGTRSRYTVGDRMCAPPRGTYWRSFAHWESMEGETLLGGVDFGSAGRVLMFSSEALEEMALPRPFRQPGGVGVCCGYRGGFGPNLPCHGCGRLVLIDVADCDTPMFTAARLQDVELVSLA